MASQLASDRVIATMADQDENAGNVALKSDFHTRLPASLGISDRTRRLGIRELGWYAHEKAMPSRVLSRIKAGDAVRVSNVVSILARVCEQDASVRSAYLCQPSVEYITKVRGEGSFCGYRNIQMLISFILGSKTEGAKAFPDGIPSILQLQDLIEDAWDRGINAEGRLETGGIRGTRKHIGTPEARALFKGLDIPCSVSSYQSTRGDQTAFHSLCDHIEDYFRRAGSFAPEAKMHQTNMSPIYLQRPRHSLTVVGLERRADGTRNFLVLDPGLRPSRQMLRAADAVKNRTVLDEHISLAPYRRGSDHLGRYRQFETLTLGAQT